MYTCISQKQPRVEAGIQLTPPGLVDVILVADIVLDYFFPSLRRRTLDGSQFSRGLLFGIFFF